LYFSEKNHTFLCTSPRVETPVASRSFSVHPKSSSVNHGAADVEEDEEEEASSCHDMADAALAVERARLHSKVGTATRAEPAMKDKVDAASVDIAAAATIDGHRAQLKKVAAAKRLKTTTTSLYDYEASGDLSSITNLWNAEKKKNSDSSNSDAGSNDALDSSIVDDDPILATFILRVITSEVSL
jgi:hypothetical protein